MERVELGVDRWFVLNDPDAISRKRAVEYRTAARVAMGRAAEVLRSEDGTLDLEHVDPTNPAMIAMTVESEESAKDALIVASVDSWSFGEVSRDAVGDISQRDFNVIYEACVTAGHAKLLTPDFSPSPDEDSPTRPS